jgi:hypothetical protein
MSAKFCGLSHIAILYLQISNDSLTSNQNTEKCPPKNFFGLSLTAVADIRKSYKNQL